MADESSIIAVVAAAMPVPRPDWTSSAKPAAEASRSERALRGRRAVATATKRVVFIFVNPLFTEARRWRGTSRPGSGPCAVSASPPAVARGRAEEEAVPLVGRRRRRVEAVTRLGELVTEERRDAAEARRRRRRTSGSRSRRARSSTMFGTVSSPSMNWMNALRFALGRACRHRVHGVRQPIAHVRRVGGVEDPLDDAEELVERGRSRAAGPARRACRGAPSSVAANEGAFRTSVTSAPPGTLRATL